MLVSLPYCNLDIYMAAHEPYTKTATKTSPSSLGLTRHVPTRTYTRPLTFQTAKYCRADVLAIYAAACKNSSTTCGSFSTSLLLRLRLLSHVSSTCAFSAVDSGVKTNTRCSPVSWISNQPLQNGAPDYLQFLYAVPSIGSSTSQSSVRKCAKAPCVTTSTCSVSRLVSLSPVSSATPEPTCVSGRWYSQFLRSAARFVMAAFSYAQ